MKNKIDFRPYRGALAYKAFKSGDTRGRRHLGNRVDVAYSYAVDPFSLDAETIRLSPAYLRLTGKTEVFNYEKNPQVRSRFTHTNEVVRLAVMAAGILGLNSNLIKSILLGHDTGYPAGGHIGEQLISEKSGRYFGHEVMSVVLLQDVLRLNLSWETITGIKEHRSGNGGSVDNDSLTLEEYKLIRYCDKIAILSDYDDALQRGFLTPAKLPAELLLLGKNLEERWQNCLFALIKESANKGRASFKDSEIAQRLNNLHRWAYPNFYKKVNSAADCQQDLKDLEEVYELLDGQRGLFNYDPLLCLAIMTDQELRKLARIARNKSIAHKIIPPDNFEFLTILAQANKEINIFDAALDANKFKNWFY